jgi:hypothetical protein
MLTHSKALLTRIKSSMPYAHPFPNLTLLSDWDVTHAISQTLRVLAWAPTFAHVKGHQDSHHAYSGLSLEAQLNVDADEEAGSYQCMYPAQRPCIPQPDLSGSVSIALLS